MGEKAKRAAKAAAPIAIIAVVVAFLCPTEFSLYIFGLRLPPHRVALIALFPAVILRLMTQRGLKFRSFDAAFIAYNVWTAGIYMYHQGQSEGLVYGGSLALESLGAYLVARVFIRDMDDLRATLRVMAIAIGAAALIALPETLFGKILTHDVLRDLTGYVHPTAVEHRVHLTRAYGTFDHPIHYGTFCAALFALFWYAERRPENRYKRAALLGAATLLGLSSAPLLCIFFQVAMLVWEHATRGVQARTGLTLVTLAGLYIGAAAVMTRSPVMFIATGMTLDSWTGYYRTQIWENGLNNVFGHPWTGIGLAEWVRPWWMVSSTVDAFWLVTMMRAGLPALALLLLGMVLLIRAVSRRGLVSKDIAIRRVARGWIMSVIALSLIGATVHYWNVLHAFFFFVVGLGGWLGDPRRVKIKAKALQQQHPAFHTHTMGPAGPFPAGAWPQPA